MFLDVLALCMVQCFMQLVFLRQGLEENWMDVQSNRGIIVSLAGYDIVVAEIALIATKNKGIQPAIDW